MVFCADANSACSSLFWVAGLPATVGQAKAGNSKSWLGMRVNWLLARRSNSSWVQSRRSGKAVSWLHESISFCSRGRWPRLVRQGGELVVGQDQPAQACGQAALGDMGKLTGFEAHHFQLWALAQHGRQGEGIVGGKQHAQLRESAKSRPASW